MSTYDPQAIDPYGMPPKKRGMSTGAKVAIILVVVFGGFGVLCCGGIVGVGWWASQSFTEEPKDVAAKTAEMAQIEIPDGFAPKGAIDIKVPFSGQRLVTMVIYADDAGSTLMLGAFAEMGGDDQQANMRRTMEQSLEKQQRKRKQAEMLILRVQAKSVEIRGEAVEFLVQEGTLGGKPRVRVTGVFPGKTGAVMLLLDADPNVMSEEDIDQMLDSIE